MFKQSPATEAAINALRELLTKQDQEVYTLICTVVKLLISDPDNTNHKIRDISYFVHRATGIRFHEESATVVVDEFGTEAGAYVLNKLSKKLDIKLIQRRI